MCGPSLVHAVRGLLEQDSFRTVARLLHTDPRLTSAAVGVVLDIVAAETRHETDQLGPSRIAAWRAFLGRCGFHTLHTVVPVDATVMDPEVVALVDPQLRAAATAEQSFARSGDPEELDRAVRDRTELLSRPELATAFPGLRAALLNDGGGARLRRFWLFDEAVDLAEAGELFAAAVDLTPPRSPRRAGRLGNLAVALREIALRQGGDGILEAAERVAREAVDALSFAPPGDRDNADVLTNLALVLRDRYQHTDDSALLTEAIACAEQACAVSDAPGPRVMLADLLGQRLPVGTDTADLKRAITTLEAVVDATPSTAPERPRRLVDLAIALTEAHEVLGVHDALDRAVRCCAEAVAHPLLAASPDLPAAQAQLAMTRYRRFEFNGRLDDLDAAVTLLGAVVESAQDQADAPGWRVNLATTLVQRSRRSGGAADLDRAIALYDAAARSALAGTDRYAVLNNLGNALRERGRGTRQLDDLNRAVDALRRAREAAGTGSAREATTCANLGSVLRDRAALTGAAEDLDAAVDCCDAALGIGGPNDVDRARRLFTLAETCWARAATGTAAEDDRERAAAAYDEGCRIGLHSDPESTLIAATDRGALATAGSSWAEAADAYGTALEALHGLTLTQVARSHHEIWLRAGARLPVAAARALVACGRPALAVTALERGRATLLSDVLGRDRVDLHDLGLVRADLRARFERARAALVRESGA